MHKHNGIAVDEGQQKRVGIGAREGQGQDQI
jgi:hypothetical protein